MQRLGEYGELGDIFVVVYSDLDTELSAGVRKDGGSSGREGVMEVALDHQLLNVRPAEQPIPGRFVFCAHLKSTNRVSLSNFSNLVSFFVVFSPK